MSKIRNLISHRGYQEDIWTRDHPKRLSVMVTNGCNLECFSCSALCDCPYGSNTFRDVRRDVKVKDLDVWLTLLSDFEPDRWVRLIGGEPTILPPKQMVELVKVIKDHGRQVSICTNGFGIFKLDPFIFDNIDIDNHKINKEVVDKCLQYFREVCYTNYTMLKREMHVDLEIRRKNNISKGLQCNIWYKTLALWEKVTYPCCNLPYLDGWNNNNIIRNSLIEAGWILDNENLIDTILDWRNTIPGDVVKSCSLDCWTGGLNVVWRPITYRRKVNELSINM